jgi:uncharacterized protein DUF1236
MPSNIVRRLVIVFLCTGSLGFHSSLAQSPTAPRSNQGARESAAGKNDSSLGKTEEERVREIMQTHRPLALSDEQRRRIQDFAAARAAEKTDSVDFSITIGAAVPRQSRLSPLPPELADALHGYNGDQYVVAKDQFVIVDAHVRRIVAIIPLR